ncbi:MAG TPA: response regulator [Bryobacteraceae bacterium]|nr:response regulator [Bryobacteraceae bacterium]
MSSEQSDSSTQTLATILAVDDDRSVLGFLDQSLRMAGYNVLLADSGWNAIEVYEKAKEHVHLLLTDVIMPDLTGPVVAERLRSVQPDLRVLFISGFHDADVVQRFVMRKGFTLLPKPFTLDGLLRVVEQSLSASPR